MKPLTPEQQKDVETRVKEFNETVERLEVAIVAYPEYVPQTDGSFKTTTKTMIVDTKYLPKPSPIQRDNIIQEG